MLELDLGLVQNVDHFRDAAELVAEPLAQSGLIHRTDQHHPLKTGVQRFVAAAEARGDGALAISADAVKEDAVVVARVRQRLEAALHLAPPAEEGRRVGHLDRAFRIQKVRLGRLHLDLPALGGPEGSDQRRRIAHPLIQAQQVPVGTSSLTRVLQEFAQHLAAHGCHRIERCLPGGEGPVELLGGEDARAVVDRLRPSENRVRPGVYQRVRHRRDRAAVRRLRRVAAGKKQKPGPASAESFGELLRRGALRAALLVFGQKLRRAVFDHAVARNVEDVEVVGVEGGHQVLQLRDGSAFFHHEFDRLLARSFQDVGLFLFVVELREHVFRRCGHEKEPQRAVGRLGVVRSRLHHANGLDA